MAVLTRARNLPMWRPLHTRDFRLLWASEAISLIGDQFHIVALAWLVIDLTQSGLALGTVLIAVSVPRALLMIPFGVLADRRSSRSLMLAAHIARGAVVGAMAALVLTGGATIPLLAALGVLFGAADAIYLPAQQAFLPRTLEPDRLPSANALIQGTLQLTSIVGPPVAGAAIAVVGTGPAFVIDATSFFLAAAVVLFISARGAAAIPTAGAAQDAGGPEDGPAAADASFAGAVREGIAVVVADPALRTTFLISLVLNFAFNGPATVGMPWLAEIRFDAGPAGLGLLTAAWAVGALAGTLVAGNATLERQGRPLLVAVAVAGLTMIVVGVAPWIGPAFVALAVMGISIGYANVVAISWIQARVAPALVGRVMSLAMLMGFGIMPLSLGVSGWLIDIDATALFLASGALAVLTALLAVAARYPAQFDAPPPRG